MLAWIARAYFSVESLLRNPYEHKGNGLFLFDHSQNMEGIDEPLALWRFAGTKKHCYVVEGVRHQHGNTLESVEAFDLHLEPNSRVILKTGELL